MRFGSQVIHFLLTKKKLRRLLLTPKIAKDKKQVIKASGIDHVHFYVKYLKKAIKFYHDVFGFKIYEGEADEGFMIIGNRNIKVYFMENVKMENLHSGGFHHFGFHVHGYEDIKKLLLYSTIQFTESE